MSMSGVTVAQESIDAAQEILGPTRNKPSPKWVMFKMSGNEKEIVVAQVGERKLRGRQADEAAQQEEWKELERKLIFGVDEPQSTDPVNLPRYAIFDFEWANEEKRQQKKVVFIAWVPQKANGKLKMLYAASKEALKNAINPSFVLQADETEELLFANVDKLVTGRS